MLQEPSTQHSQQQSTNVIFKFELLLIQSSFICLQLERLQDKAGKDLVISLGIVFKRMNGQEIYDITEKNQRMCIRCISLCIRKYSDVLIGDTLIDMATVLELFAQPSTPATSRFEALFCIRTKLFRSFPQLNVSKEEEMDIDNKVASLCIELMLSNDHSNVKSALWMVGSWVESVQFPEEDMERVCTAVVELVHYWPDSKHAALATLYILVGGGQFPDSLVDVILDLFGQLSIGNSEEFGVILQMLDCLCANNKLNTSQINALVDDILVRSRSFLLIDSIGVDPTNHHNSFVTKTNLEDISKFLKRLREVGRLSLDRYEEIDNFVAVVELCAWQKSSSSDSDV